MKEIVLNSTCNGNEGQLMKSFNDIEVSSSRQMDCPKQTMSLNTAFARKDRVFPQELEILSNSYIMQCTSNVENSF